jgi:hypothetical protein
MAILFGLISLTSIYLLYSNYTGRQLDLESDAQLIDQLTLANQEGIDLNELNEDNAEDELDDLDDRQIRMVGTDFIICFLFFCFILYYRIRSIVIINTNYTTNIILSDFALEISGIPKIAVNEKDIREHFEKFGEVHEVALTKIYNNALDLYK